MRHINPPGQIRIHPDNEALIKENEALAAENNNLRILNGMLNQQANHLQLALNNLREYEAKSKAKDYDALLEKWGKADLQIRQMEMILHSLSRGVDQNISELDGKPFFIVHVDPCNG